MTPIIIDSWFLHANAKAWHSCEIVKNFYDTVDWLKISISENQNIVRETQMGESEILLFRMVPNLTIQSWFIHEFWKDVHTDDE